MDTVSFPVMACETVELGTVTVPRNGTGSSIWQQARQLAGQVWHTDPNNISISSVVVRGGEHISMASASSMQVTKLASDKCVVLVQQPPDALPAWERRMNEMQGQMLQQLHDLRKSHDELKQSHDALVLRTYPIAVRSVVDKVRTKMNNDQQLSSEQKQEWNKRIEQMQDTELDALGLTRRQVQLTKYGHQTVQGRGNVVAHSFSIEEEAAAVTCLDADHRQLFQFVHGCSPEEYVFDD